jgi:hypothetical protein
MFSKVKKMHIKFVNKNIDSFSIVIYKENFKVLEKAMDSFLDSTLSKKLYIIDNSPDQMNFLIKSRTILLNIFILIKI